MKTKPTLILITAALAGWQTDASAYCWDPVPWTDAPYYGEAGIFFADMNGDDLADAVVMNYDANGQGSPAYAISVRFATGTYSPIVQPQPFDRTVTVLATYGPSDWPAFGPKNFVLDVNADGFADVIHLDPNTIRVRINPGSVPLAPSAAWSSTGFAGSVGTFMADVDNDQRADVIAVNGTNIKVRRSTGTSFDPEETWAAYKTISAQPEHGWFFADVTGDGKADAIAVRAGRVAVRRSTGSSFGVVEYWTSGPYFGDYGTFFADVTGDGKADAIVTNSTGVVVRRSNGSSFDPNELWLSDPQFSGSFATAFAPVTNTSRADFIMVDAYWTGNGMQGRANTGSSFLYQRHYCP